MIIFVKCFNLLRMIKKIFIVICLLFKMFDMEILFYKQVYMVNVLKSGIESVFSGFYFFLNRMLEKAILEDYNEFQKLILVLDNDIESDLQKKERSKSSEFLKQELEKYGRIFCRDYILKVNLVMFVLYARQLLVSLLV